VARFGIEIQGGGGSRNAGQQLTNLLRVCREGNRRRDRGELCGGTFLGRTGKDREEKVGQREELKYGKRGGAGS